MARLFGNPHKIKMEEGFTEFANTVLLADNEVLSSEEPPTQVVRQNAIASKGVKRPYRDFEVERPDLAHYFDEFADFGPEISDAERIRMCRAYASYLASLQAPAAPKKGKSKK